MQLALIEVASMAAGAFLSRLFVKWVSREGERGLVLMASVTAWTILFGLLPFFLFSLYVSLIPGGTLGGFETIVFNLVPFTLITSPLFGFSQGLMASRRKRSA